MPWIIMSSGEAVHTSHVDLLMCGDSPDAKEGEAHAPAVWARTSQGDGVEICKVADVQEGIALIKKILSRLAAERLVRASAMLVEVRAEAAKH